MVGKFIKAFIIKHLSVEVLESILIDILRALAKKTKTTLDDKIVEKVFGTEKE